MQVPIDSLGRAAAGLGHLNANPDVDGGIRTEPLVLRYFEQLLPVAVADDRGEEPQPRRRRHQGRRSARA